MCECKPQPVCPLSVNSPEPALQLPESLPPLGRGLSLYQVPDRLRLKEIHPSIEEGAAGELARLGGPGSEPDQRFRHPG